MKEHLLKQLKSLQVEVDTIKYGVQYSLVEIKDIELKKIRKDLNNLHILINNIEEMLTKRSFKIIKN